MVGLHRGREGAFEVGVGEGQIALGGFGGGVDGEAGAVEGGAGLDAVGFVDEANCEEGRGLAVCNETGT